LIEKKKRIKKNTQYESGKF